MSAINPPKRITKHQELRQDTVVTAYARTWGFFDKNRTLVFGILGAIVVVVLGVVGYTLYLANQQEKATELLGAVEDLYHEGNYRAALDGSEGKPGLLAIADDYGRTQAGNLATFYAADALFRIGEYDRALELFNDFDKDDTLIGASALAGEAAVYEQKEDFRRAGDLYRRAALLVENELTSPQYLLDAGIAYERAGAFDDARKAYETISERFPESVAAQNVEFYLARVDARAGTAS